MSLLKIWGLPGWLFLRDYSWGGVTVMPRPKERVVTLTAADRARLTKVVTRGTHPARMITRARILLELDETEVRD
ncbi:hypothetical protein [Georgenia yuyongxinii]